MDDTIVKSIETAPNDELKKAKEIIQRIRRRELYKVAVLFSCNIVLLFCLLFYCMLLTAICAETVDLTVMHVQYYLNVARVTRYDR